MMHNGACGPIRLKTSPQQSPPMPYDNSISSFSNIEAMNFTHLGNYALPSLPTLPPILPTIKNLAPIQVCILLFKA